MSSDFKPVPEAALTGSLRDFRAPEGPDLMERIGGFYTWQNLRREHQLGPMRVRPRPLPPPIATRSATRARASLASISAARII